MRSRNVAMGLVLGVAGTAFAGVPAGAAPVPAGPVQAPLPALGNTQVYVTDQSPPDWFQNGMILKVDLGTGARTLVSDNANPVGGPSLQGPVGIVVDGNGDLLVAESFELDINGIHTPSIVRVNRTTGVRTLVSSNTAPNNGPDLVAPYGIAVEANGSIVVADPVAFTSGNGGVIRIDPVTGVRTTLSRNQAPVGGPSFAGPGDLAVAANGDIYVLDNNGVIRVNPVSGARTQISANNFPAGGPVFVHPSFMTVDAAGDILVTDWGPAGAGGSIIRVNPVTGVRTLVSDNATPAGGPSFGLLGDLVVNCDKLLVVDISNGAVLRVDPVTGVRTTVSDNTSAGVPAYGYPFGIAVRRTMACP